MRLYNIYYILKKAQPILKVTGLERIEVPVGKFYWNFTKWVFISEQLLILKQLDFIKNDAEEAYNKIPPMERKPIPEITENVKSTFMSSLSILINKVDAIVSLYESIKDDKSNIGIDIKIPDVNDFNEYISYLKELEFIFYQTPYLLNRNEKLQFNTVDIGSNWLEFLFIASGSCHILNNLASLIKKAFDFRSYNNLLKIQKETLTTMKLKNEQGKEVIDLYKILKDDVLNQYISELQTEIAPLKDGEEEAKVKLSIEKLSNLIDKGVEIYSSIESPKDIKALFPFENDKILLSDGLLKMIEDKANTQHTSEE